MARKASGQEFIKHKTNIIANISEHFNNADISDVTLTVGEQVCPAHRFVLATQSKVFKTMLMGENWKESEERKITLQESPEGVAAFSDFLKFLYTGTLTLTIDNVCGIHTLADKYDVPALKDDCVGFIKDVLTGIHGDALKAGLIWLQYVESFLSDMVALCYSAIRTNLTGIIDGKEYKTLFWKLTYDQVNNVLSVPEVQEELVLASEEELYDLLDKGKWAKRLLPFVRFHNIDFDHLQTFKSSNNLTKHYNEAYKIQAEWASIASKELKKRRLSEGSVEVTCSCGTSRSQTCPHINPRLYFALPFGVQSRVEESDNWTIKVKSIDLSDLVGFSQTLLHFTGDENPNKVWKCTLQTDYSGDPIFERYIVKPAKSYVGKHFTLAIAGFQPDEEGSFAKFDYVIKYTGVVTMSGEETNTIMLTSPLRFKGSWDMKEKAGIGMAILLHR
ncbi:kelch-like protein 28 [Amphiura filiformis]|uniref:kelch-like protein 28 n=1 Tax=Amphiura filiformis TaxID=82378 RepID=UPI003B21AE3B